MPPKRKRRVNFEKVYQECRKKAHKEVFAELQFDLHPTAETFLLAEKIARRGTDDYAKERLSTEDFERFQEIQDDLKAVVGAMGLDALLKISYWGARLGLFAAGEERVSVLIDHARGYCVAEHQMSRSAFEKLPVNRIAEILRADAQSKGRALSQTGGGILGGLVTLSQVAAFVKKNKRTLERYVEKGTLPQPDVYGGEGRAHKWYWSRLRPMIQKFVPCQLPERFPDSPFI